MLLKINKYNTKLLMFCLLFLLFIPLTLTAQDILETEDIPEELDPAERISLAVSNIDYRVTPGDTYQLAYQPGEELITILIPVEADFSLNLGILGKMDGYGLTFVKLKEKIEMKFLSAYPQSMPSLTIYSAGIFRVQIKGEIPLSKYVDAWGLSRLDTILQNNLGPYSSIRDVIIESTKGDRKSYDLFKALIFGDNSQNPFVKPGDIIIVTRRNINIELQGEIYRPGKYQILKDDNLSDIIHIYGGDFTERADITKIRIEREQDNIFGLINYEDKAEKKGYNLFRDGDIIIIDRIAKKNPVIFIEGAVITPAEDTIEQQYNRILQLFLNGQTLYDVLNNVKNQISQNADLANSYIIRNKDGEQIPVNLMALIYNYDLSNNIPMQPFDTIIIPFKSLSVIVSGAVTLPGAYPFSPNKLYNYYINLAGGINYERNDGGGIQIRDFENNKKKRSQIIKPGDIIFIPSNSFMYNFTRFSPLITTTLSVFLSALVLWDRFN